MEIKDIIELMRAVSDNALTSFELEEGNLKVSMKREKKTVTPSVQVIGGQTASQVSGGQAWTAGSGEITGILGLTGLAGVQAAGEETTNSAGTPGASDGVSSKTSLPCDMAPDRVVTCPLVGTFYSSPSPEAEDFVKVGDAVKKGQVLGIVEAMKLMNEIECEYDGVIDAILVKNEEVVEFGQPLFRIR